MCDYVRGFKPEKLIFGQNSAIFGRKITFPGFIDQKWSFLNQNTLIDIHLHSNLTL